MLFGVDRTGIARGSLNPVIYFENASHEVILPPEEIGVVGIARRVYEEKYKALGWQWCEAGTLNEVDALQKRLVDQELRRNERMADSHQMQREELFRRSGEVLRQIMLSSSTSAWERDFIALYLKLRDKGRDKYRDVLLQHNYFLWSREFDSTTKIEDHTANIPGLVERPGV